MRMWIGEEREGLVRDKTLFIECSHIDQAVIDKVISACDGNGCRRAYFGAGRKDVLYVDETALKKLDVSMAVETSIQNVNAVWGVSCWHVIVRIEMDGLPSRDNFTMKIDNMHTWCSTSSGMVANDISDVKDGKYSTDKEIS